MRQVPGDGWLVLVAEVQALLCDRLLLGQSSRWAI